MEDVLLKEAEAAKRLGVSVHLLRKWRSKRGGPHFLKLGHSVRYSPAQIESFLAERICTSTSDEAYQRERKREATPRLSDSDSDSKSGTKPSMTNRRKLLV